MTKQKKNAGKFAAKKKSKKWLLIVAALIAVFLAAILLYPDTDDGENMPEATDAVQTAAPEQDEQQNSGAATPSVNLGYGIYVREIGSYTGMYMEDGTDEVLSGVLMLVVKNDGAQDIQYAEVTMDIGEQQAVFVLTTLPVGESMVMLEKNRMTWDETVDYDAILPKVNNIAYFQEPISILEEKVNIQITDGALNVTNISGEDISGTITVYYKNAAADLLYGGITYRVTIDGGLKADEIRQVMTNHASDTGSRIMFATIVP